MPVYLSTPSLKEEKEETMKNNVKDVFANVYKNLVKRKGATELLEYLEQSDFFVAPASCVEEAELKTEGDLARLSLITFCNLLDLVKSNRYLEYNNTPEENEKLAIISLLHTLGRVGVYEKYTKNQKIDGSWQEVEAFKYVNAMPIPSGESAVLKVLEYMKLSEEEFLAIRYYDGGIYDNPSVFPKIIKKYPLVFLLHIANMEAVWFSNTDQTVAELSKRIKGFELNTAAEEVENEETSSEEVTEKVTFEYCEKQFTVDKRFENKRLTKGKGIEKPSPIEDFLKDPERVRYIALKKTWDASELYEQMLGQICPNWEDEKSFKEAVGC